MVRICITKTSDWTYVSVKEYESLEACVNEFLVPDLFGNFNPELVISRPDDCAPREASDCDYVVEIYDTWREE